MRLPDGDRAVVDAGKPADYCLPPTHPRGRHKARGFAAMLGFTTANAVVLRAALLQAARDAEAVPTRHNEYGQLYEVVFPCTGPVGSAEVVSAWVVLDADPVPRLVTCYPA